MVAVAVNAEVSQSELSWEEAIARSCAVLEATGAVHASYAQRCIDNVRTHGPYLVVAPGIALVHAEPGPDTPGLGLSALRLDRPTESGHEHNDPVDLLLAFATPDRTVHLELLGSLATALSGDLATELRAAHSANEMASLVRGAVGNE